MDWCDGSPVGSLARKSYALHAELAETLGADCGYRRMRTHSVSIGRSGKKRPGWAGQQLAHDLPEWIDAERVTASSGIGSEETTAQVRRATGIHQEGLLVSQPSHRLAGSPPIETHYLLSLCCLLGPSWYSHCFLPFEVLCPLLAPCPGEP